MNEFVDRIDFLLSQKKLKRSNLYDSVKEINSHSFYDWSRRGTVPSADIALKIAKYLDTSVEFLLTGRDENPLSEKVDMLTKKIEAAKKILE